MSHYEERLHADLEKIRSRLVQMGRGVIEALQNAAQAVLTRDEDLAAETILGDLPINRRYRSLDHHCHVFVARHLPSAGHLRFVSAALRLSKTLERVGDYAETVSRAALQLSQRPPDRIRQDIEMMSQHSINVLEQSLQAFQDGNADLARGTLAHASQYGRTFDKVFQDLILEGEKQTRPIADLFSLMAIFNRFERVIHQAKNVCEQTVFVVTGETKDEKTFDILFVDNRNAGASLLAEHYARRAYPDAGTFKSAGWESGDEVDPAFAAFAEEKGFSMIGVEPRSLDSILNTLHDFDIIIDLTGKARSHIPKVPFHTTLLSWPIPDRTAPEPVYRELAPRLAALIERLRGDED